MKFNVDEIFEMAEHIERNGAQFYRRAAGIVQDPKGKELMLGLAAMEDEHEKTYAEMRLRVNPAGQQRDTVYEGDDSAVQYIRAWADKNVFDIDASIFESLKGTETLVEIINKAIQREKETIIFFTGLKESLSSDEDRENVERIILEEVQHISILTKERKALAG